MSRITFDISRLVPRFLYKDRNGYAISKAIERAFQYVAEKVEGGLDVIQDPDSMPEWRLDELAWEYGIVYDYAAPVRTKRNWIRNAIYMYSLLGTPEGMKQYLEGRYAFANVKEASEYGGDPFHFRVYIGGEYSQALNAWTEDAINKTKSLRSVLDGIIFSGTEVTMATHWLTKLHAIGGVETGSILQSNAYREAVESMYDIAEASGSVVQTEDAIPYEAVDVQVSIVPSRGGSGVASRDNVRPIHGWLGVNLNISPTTSEADGTVRSISWENAAGMVYGGAFDVTAGLLTSTWNYIESYAGETIPGRWISSMDEYAPATLPSIGAQVIWQYLNRLVIRCGNINVYDSEEDAPELSFCSGAQAVYTSGNEQVMLIYSGETAVYQNYAGATQYEIDGTNIILSAGAQYIRADTGEVWVQYRHY